MGAFYSDESPSRSKTYFFLRAAGFLAVLPFDAAAGFGERAGLDGLMASMIPPVSRVSSTMCLNSLASRVFVISPLPSHRAISLTLSMPRPSAE